MFQAVCVAERRWEEYSHCCPAVTPKTRRCGEVKVGKIKTGKNPFIIWHQTFHHAETLPMADIKMLQFYIYSENVYIQSNAKAGKRKEEQEIIIGFQQERAAGDRRILCSAFPTFGEQAAWWSVSHYWHGKRGRLHSSFKTKISWTLKDIEPRGAALPSADSRLARANLVQDETTAFI